MVSSSLYWLVWLFFPISCMPGHSISFRPVDGLVVLQLQACISLQEKVSALALSCTYFVTASQMAYYTHWALVLYARCVFSSPKWARSFPQNALNNPPWARKQVNCPPARMPARAPARPLPALFHPSFVFLLRAQTKPWTILPSASNYIRTMLVGEGGRDGRKDQLGFVCFYIDIYLLLMTYGAIEPQRK